MKYTQTNKIMAKECEVYLQQYGSRKSQVRWVHKNGDEVGCGCCWTIKNPICREVIRERFNICTEINRNKIDAFQWCSFALYKSGRVIQNYSQDFYKTIQEAEIAYILAIVGELTNDK